MHDLTDFIHNGYKPCGKKCDSSKNSVKSQRYVIFSVTDRKHYIRRDSTCSTQKQPLEVFLKKVLQNWQRIPVPGPLFQRRGSSAGVSL